MRDPDNFLLIQKNCFLIRENCFLIREDLIQGGLVLYDRRLIMKQRFLDVYKRQVREAGVDILAELEFLVQDASLYH